MTADLQQAWTSSVPHKWFYFRKMNRGEFKHFSLQWKTSRLSLPLTHKWFYFRKINRDEFIRFSLQWKTSHLSSLHHFFHYLWTLHQKQKQMAAHFLLQVSVQKVFFLFQEVQREEHPVMFKKKRNILIIFHILNLFKHLNPKRAALIFNGSRKYYPNKLNASFIILHGVSHINHQLIKKIPNITP